MGSNPIPRTFDGPVAVDTSTVVQFLKNKARKGTIIAAIGRKLRNLAKNINLNNPEKVKAYVAGLSCSDGHRDNIINAYSHYRIFPKYSVEKSIYQREERMTKIPKEEDINKVIAEEYLVKATEKVEGANILLEQGFEFVCKMDNLALFRKRE